MDLNTLILLFVLLLVFALSLLAMIELAKITPSDIVVDLGSGDGRMVIAGAQAGAQQAIGYEVHPGLVQYSRRRIRKLSLSNARIEQVSLWDAPLGDVTVVLMYQIPHSMEKLEKKLRSELPKGARVVSHGFEFPNWKKQQTSDRSHLYIT